MKPLVGAPDRSVGGDERFPLVLQRRVLSLPGLSIGPVADGPFGGPAVAVEAFGGLRLPSHFDLP